MEILYKKYGETEYRIVDDSYLKDGFSFSDPEPNTLMQFRLKLFQPKDAETGELLNIDNGDEILIVDSTYTEILDNIRHGIVYEQVVTPKGHYIEGDSINFYKEFLLTIEQRDFSLLPFKLSTYSFIDNSMYQSLSSVLDTIFDNQNIRDDLGGILSDGTIIPPYVLLADDIEVQITDDLYGIAREQLNNILSSIFYKWSITYYSEPDEDSKIKVIQQVQIWQD